MSVPSAMQTVRLGLPDAAGGIRMVLGASAYKNGRKW
jgi:hypothetical protein